MILSGAFREFRSDRVDPVHPRDPALFKIFGFGNNSSSGVAVNHDSAWRVATAMAAIKVISETLASLPLFTYQRREDGGKDVAKNHPLYALLHDEPNVSDTSYEWRLLSMSQILTRGNTFSQIFTARNGSIGELVNVQNDQIQAFRGKDGRIHYDFWQRGNSNRVLLQDEVFHVKGPSKDGITGLSPIEECRDAFGLAIGSELFGSRFFANDARPGLVLKHPKSLSSDAQKRLKESWVERFSGASKAHQPAVLEEGLDVQPIGVPAKDAQFLETRKFQREEIAAIFRVPPHMIGILERATNNNIEQQSLEFVMHTMRPWLVAWEQAIKKRLMTSTEKKTLVSEFSVDALLRGDLKSRYESYGIGRNWGWLSVNDILRLENRNPIADGDIYLQPLNTAPAGSVPEVIKKTGENKDGD